MVRVDLTRLEIKVIQELLDDRVQLGSGEYSKREQGAIKTAFFKFYGLVNDNKNG